MNFMKIKLKKVRLALLGALVCLAVCFGIYYLPCIISKLWYDMLGFQRRHFAFVKFHGRLANQMFQYAFLFAVSKKLDITMVIPEDQKLTDAFGIEVQTPSTFGLSDNLYRCMSLLEDKWDCAYDSSLMNLTKSRDHSFFGYYQSWKYWKEYEQDIRNKFLFRSSIVKKSSNILKNILSDKEVLGDKDIVLVGVHVRNGDYSKGRYVEYGYRLPTKKYLQHAMQYFKERHKRVLFIVCTNDYFWTLNTLGYGKDIHIVTGNSPEVDMALLTMTHHTIMTVGTFGWWIAFLTNGTTIYYKNLFVEGSDFSKQFHGDVSEHFYPGWIGLD